MSLKQMHAAVGQPRLHALYQRLFGALDIQVAQVLLTRSDVENRRRYLNAREALTTMLAHGVLPIVNENDTVATEEIRLGDNDMLSALVAGLVDADRLVLLTDQAGLYDRDPRVDPQARLISRVGATELTEQMRAAAGGSGRLGTGIDLARVAWQPNWRLPIWRGVQAASRISLRVPNPTYWFACCRMKPWEHASSWSRSACRHASATSLAGLPVVNCKWTTARRGR